MGSHDYFKPGVWNFWCQQCGRKLKADEGKKRWDGLWVGPECFEIRNPQDFVRGIPDNQGIPWSTGDPPWVYVGNTGNVAITPSRTMGSYFWNRYVMG
jgi:hypothetical protein